MAPDQAETPPPIPEVIQAVFNLGLRTDYISYIVGATPEEVLDWRDQNLVPDDPAIVLRFRQLFDLYTTIAEAPPRHYDLDEIVKVEEEIKAGQYVGLQRWR